MKLKGSRTRRRKWILVGIASVILFSVIAVTFTRRTVYSVQTDPTGKYTAIFSFKSHRSLMSMVPGDSSSKPCFIRIRGVDGTDYGEIPVPMIQLAELLWGTNSAEVKLVGEWDFAAGTCWYLSEDQERKIYVRK